MNLIDRIVGYVAPNAALKRMQARRMLDFAQAHGEEINRAYASAKIDRFTSNWRAPNRSADRELEYDADVTRGRARQLVRDNAYVKGIIRAAVRNIVGPGIKPQAKVQLPDGEPHEALNERIESLWDRWQMHADVTGRMSFYEIQQLVVSERWEAGELLIQFIESDDPLRPVPFALELIDVDRLASNEKYPKWHSDNGNEVRRGVEIDKTGRPVAYWLYPYHPSDLNTISTTPQRYPAENFLHLYRPSRIGQTRGISELAPILPWSKHLDSYMDNEMKASMIASCFSVAIKSLSAGADGAVFGGPSTDDGVDQNSNPFEYLEPGLVARLFPEEEVQVINPMRNHADATAWLTLMQRSMGVGVGLSYERLTRDYSQTNYSSNRASDLEDRREFRMEQQWLITHLCIPVYQRFMSSVMQHRDLYDWMPKELEYLANRTNYNRCDWNPPGWEWVDPLKEVNAIVTAMDNNLTTLAAETQKRDGGDWRANLKQRGIEHELAEQNGLAPKKPTSENTNNASMVGADEENDDAEDSDEQAEATASNASERKAVAV